VIHPNALSIFYNLLSKINKNEAIEELKKLIPANNDYLETREKFKKFSVDLRQTLHKLLIRFKQTMHASKNSTAEHVRVDASFEHILEFTIKFRLAGFKLKVRRVKYSARHYPFTGHKYLEFQWVTDDDQAAQTFLSMFYDLDISLKVVWIRDFLQLGVGVRIDNPEEDAPCVLDDNKYEEFKRFVSSYGIKAPLMELKKVVVGETVGERKNKPTFKIIFLADMEPFKNPTGTLNITCSTETFLNNRLQGEFGNEESELIVEEEILYQAKCDANTQSTDFVPDSQSNGSAVPVTPFLCVKFMK